MSIQIVIFNEKNEFLAKNENSSLLDSMKVNKTQGLLYIQTLLLEKGFFTYEEVIATLEISSLTFHRYVQEIRAYYCNFNINKELKYSRSKRLYYIHQK